MANFKRCDRCKNEIDVSKDDVSKSRVYRAGAFELTVNTTQGHPTRGTEPQSLDFCRQCVHDIIDGKELGATA